MKSDPYHTPFTKINLKWIKNVNTRPAMVKLLGKKNRENLDIGLSHDYFV